MKYMKYMIDCEIHEIHFGSRPCTLYIVMPCLVWREYHSFRIRNYSICQQKKQEKRWKCDFELKYKQILVSIFTTSVRLPLFQKKKQVLIRLLLFGGNIGARYHRSRRHLFNASNHLRRKRYSTWLNKQNGNHSQEEETRRWTHLKCLEYI